MSKLLLLFGLFMFECATTSGVATSVEENPYAKMPIYNYGGDANKISFSEYQTAAETDIEDKLAAMSLDEKLGQLFNIRVMTNTNRNDILKAKALIKDYHVGGITLFREPKKGSSPVQQSKIINELQALSKDPLMVALDAEWGLNMRLDSTVNLPRQLTLGAIQDEQIIFEMGKEIGRQLKRTGVHVNFAPVIDVNNNINNPVINDRSFGDDIYSVARKGNAYMRGMHQAGVLATAKHFPGHGDTDKDSHYDLPIVNHSWERLDSLELYPFKQLIQNRLGGIMIAHLSIPQLDPSPNRPTTLSKYVVTNLLRNQMGFDGLVWTDALDMKAVTKHFPSGRAEVEALKAGNDVLLLSTNVPTAIAAIKAAITSGELSEARIDESLRRILAAKRWMGILHNTHRVAISNLTADINRPSAHLLNQKLFDNAVTLVKNNSSLIPLTDLQNYKIASVGIDNGKRMPFQTALDPYAPMQHYYIDSNAPEASFNTLLSQLSQYNLVIVGKVNKSRYASRNFGITLAEKSFIRRLKDQTQAIVSVFGNPYSMSQFDQIPTLICGYDSSDEAQKAVAQGIFGAIGFKGRLPVATGYLPRGIGQDSQGGIRLKYTVPEELGVESGKFYKIDSIAEASIRIRATPGCQVLVAKDGKVIYHKAFGYHTYNKQQHVAINDVYDLASITKIGAAVPSLMKAYESGLINPSDQLFQHYPRAAGTTKSNMIIAEILNHTSGLKSWIPFYRKTMSKAGTLNSNYNRSGTGDHILKVADKMFIKGNYPHDSIMQYIFEAPNNTRGRYVYSDLGYYFFKEIVQNKYGKPLDEFAAESFYRPLGLKTMGYHPLGRMDRNRIVPSEKDDYWRHQTLRGYVHDMGAAMQGGVGGHAGLFGNSNDLAIYMQMLMNGGSYGGRQYFQSSTVKHFTRRYNNNSRRALGFDKAELNMDKLGPTGGYASANSFGHTGFTGTYAWADPDYNLVYIFLSNRTYPSASNRKLISEGTRTQIQDVIYEILVPGAVSREK